jgi:outer membrane protein assembly factor BamB
VYAYDKDTGQQVWVSEYLGEEWETIYGNQPITAYSTAGADGKLYFASTTIYRMMPRTRFHETVCIDEYTGKFIWRLPIGIECSAIADGYLLGHDQDNGIMYCIGKGKTETSVTGPDVAVSEGTSVLISGSVMDMSPGAPNTPAVSDEDMSEWMDYMYGQNATLINNPPTPKGVPVKLAYQSGDGNWIDIDEVVSDDHGNFGLMWTPPDEGTYAVKAFFLGSESYFGSSGTTFVAVGPAASPTGPIEPEPTIEPLITTEVAIIAVVAVAAVIGVASFWALKKRK